MEARDTVTKTTEENCHNTLEERLIEQAEISFRVGGREMFKKTRQALRGETVVFDYALDPFEIQWLYEQTKRLFKPNLKAGE